MRVLATAWNWRGIGILVRGQGLPEHLTIGESLAQAECEQILAQTTYLYVRAYDGVGDLLWSREGHEQ